MQVSIRMSLSRAEVISFVHAGYLFRTVLRHWSGSFTRSKRFTNRLMLSLPGGNRSRVYPRSAILDAQVWKARLASPTKQSQRRGGRLAAGWGFRVGDPGEKLEPPPGACSSSPPFSHSMPPALLFRRGRYGVGAAKSVSGHTVEPPEAGDARRSGNPKGRLKKPTGCVAALVRSARSNGARLLPCRLLEPAQASIECDKCGLGSSSRCRSALKRSRSQHAPAYPCWQLELSRFKIYFLVTWRRA